jgi:hypothetical protein
LALQETIVDQSEVKESVRARYSSEGRKPPFG